MYILSSIVPVMAVIVVICGVIKKENVYAEFVLGAKSGLESVLAVFPSLMALFIAVSMFRTSGLLDFLVSLASPVTSALHFPSELLPFAVLRPVSGSGSLALASDLFSSFGPDSFVGRAASVMMGSTETTFYTVAVYFGACGIKNTGYTLKCALMADVFSMIMSVIITEIYW